MRPFPLTNRGLTLPAIVTLVLLAALAALLAGVSAASAQGSAPDTPDQPIGTAVFIGGVDLEWNDVPGADSYDVQLFRNGQWIDLPGDGVEIAFYGAGAIISELNHGGSSYWFQVRARNAHGSSDWSAFFNMNTTSEYRSGRQARPDNVIASGAPVINGTAQVGDTLTTDTTGIEDGNGLDRVEFRFQWVSNDRSADADIAGATDSTYTLAANDEGKTIKVRVAFTDRGGYAESLTSAATEEVSFAIQEQIANNPATGTPTITGTAQVGETLTADVSGIADADGLTNASYSYQWISNDGNSDTDITDATDSTYTLAAADEGKTIKVQVAFADDAANEETLVSAATAAVKAKPIPATVSHITVEVTEDTSDPNNIVTNFTVTWSDADHCSSVYNAYLNIRPGNEPDNETPGSQLNLGSTAADGSEITKGLTGIQGPIEGFNVALYCGTDGSGRLVSKVAIPSSDARPKPGTYSTEPPLSALSVSHGPLTPTFEKYTFGYTVPDVANADSRITITATPKPGYAIDFFESGPRLIELSDATTVLVPVTAVAFSSFGPDGPPSGLSPDCHRGYSDLLGPLPELADADPGTAGFQVDLYDGVNFIHVRVYPTAICDPGTGYNLAITRAEGSVSLVRPNRPPVGLPRIGPSYTRGPCVGCALNADVSGITDRDGWDSATFGYQWLADDAEIAGATSSSYTAADTVLGKTVKVRVSFTDDRGTEETVTSSATKVVKLRNFEPTGRPIVLGTLEVGQTLTADVSGISDPNGMTNATFSYWWVSFYGPGADNDEYTLVTADAGRSGMWLRVTYTDDAGHEERVDSGPIGVVAAAPNSPATGAPTISGTARVGETLTADTTGITDADGLTNVSFSYQWVSNNGSSDTDITGATDSTYTLVADDEGKTIKVQVTFIDDDGYAESLLSAATSTVAKSSIPTIRGIAKVGEILTADTTALADGLLRTSFAYKWISNDGTSDNDIPNATDSTYTLVADDEGRTIKVQVTFTNDQGNQESLTSDATTAVAARANSAATGTPVITGTTQVSETLTADVTGIADADGLTGATFSYQWISNDGTSDTDITGATDSSYTLVADDEGKTIKVQVAFADDAANGETLVSAATAAVEAKLDPKPISPITVEVTEDTSDPNNIVTNFNVTWSDAVDCSTNYNAYLNIRPGNRPGHETPGSQLHLGSAATDSTEITKGLSDVQGAIEGFNVELYCGTEGTGRLVSRIDIPSASARPQPGTYSWELPLSALSVSHGTLTPTFFNENYIRYIVPDIANADTRITITATPKAGYAVDFYEESGGAITGLAGYKNPRRPSEGCSSRVYSDHLGPLPELADADPNTPGFQVDLYDGVNHIHVRVYPNTADCHGTGYTLSITRAEGSVSVVRPNRPTVGLPHIPPHTRGPCVGCTEDADVSRIKDRDGWDPATFGYHWLADDVEIAGATSSSYTPTDAVLGKTLKVRVTFTDDRGTEETVTSPATKVVKLPNVEPTGKPVILGTLEVGQTLTADVSGISDPNGMTNATFTYWWNFNGPVRDGEEYTLVDSDEGHCGCSLIVTYTDDAGHEERVRSESIGVVSPNSNSPATGVPAITGTAQVGETLTADTSGIADSDGLTGVSYGYQWISNDGASDTDIAGATSSSYALLAADEGNSIKVKVSFTDDAGSDETLTSTATGAVTAAEPEEPPSRPQGLTGTVAHDAVSLTWDDPGDATITGYKILRRDRALHGNGEFQVHVDDTGSAAAAYIDRDVSPEGSYVYRIKARNAAGLSGRSGHFRADTPSAPSQNRPATGAPDIGGTARVGETLSADVSGIADSDGLSGATFSYQWVANDGNTDTDIAGATDSTYTLAASDEGSAIKVRVSFTDDAGYAETLSSAATAAVAAQNSPAIKGVVRVGETLTVDTSGIADGLSGVTLSYQWVSNDGTTDTDIVGATGSTYTLTANDEGKIIKVRVTFTLTSTATEEVEADGN